MRIEKVAAGGMEHKSLLAVFLTYSAQDDALVK